MRRFSDRLPELHGVSASLAMTGPLVFKMFEAIALESTSQGGEVRCITMPLANHPCTQCGKWVACSAFGKSRRSLVSLSLTAVPPAPAITSKPISTFLTVSDHEAICH